MEIRPLTEDCGYKTPYVSRDMSKPPPTMEEIDAFFNEMKVLIVLNDPARPTIQELRALYKPILDSFLRSLSV